MHEMSIVKEIMDNVEIVSKDKLQKVTKITLNIGIYASISIVQLKHAFNLRKIDTIFKNCDLIIKRTKGKKYCENCHKEYIFNLNSPNCPICNTNSNKIINGFEMKIISIEGEEIEN